MNRLRIASRRLRSGWRPLAESTAGATLAWILDTTLTGHPQPYFAPAAAIIVLGQARGMRIRRAVEVLLGVAGGILLADIVAQLLRVQTTLTVFTLIALSLAITTAIGAGPMVVVQSTGAALYVAVVAPPSHSLVPLRFIDALIGGGLALLINQVGVARDPLAPLVQEMRGVCDNICSVIEMTAVAIEQRDIELARDALMQARTSDAAVDDLRNAASGAMESLQLDVWRRHRRHGVQTVQDAAREIDYVLRGVRVLARAAATLTRWPTDAAPELPTALRHLSAAVGYLGAALISELRGDAVAYRSFGERLESAALMASSTARPLLWTNQPPPVVMIVGQLRTITIDVMRGVGGDDAEVLIRVDRELGFPTS